MILMRVFLCVLLLTFSPLAQGTKSTRPCQASGFAVTESSFGVFFQLILTARDMFKPEVRKHNVVVGARLSQYLREKQLTLKIAQCTLYFIMIFNHVTFAFFMHFLHCPIYHFAAFTYNVPIVYGIKTTHPCNMDYKYRQHSAKPLGAKMFFDSAIYPQDDFKVDDDGNSKIQQYYTDSTIFITGGTGYIGKLLVEKLLRTCRNLKKIYLLVRRKKEDSTIRLEKLFDECIFDKVKREQNNIFEKVNVMCGDLTLPNLGLTQQDQETLISEVNCIFHVAATVRFDEKLRIATHINVKATRDMLELAKQIKNFKSFVHVSTAFSFCPLRVIDEVKYQTKMKAEELITLVDTLDEAQLEAVTPTILGKWPNTYTFTKAITEDLIIRTAGNLPFAIVRPSIVVPTAKEPLQGWLDNYSGIVGLHVGIELGVFHVLKYNWKRALEVVPADYVVNNIIAIGWETGTNTVGQVYNYVSSNQKPIYCDVAAALVKKNMKDIPTMHQFWHQFLVSTSNDWIFMVLHYIFHIFFAYIFDFVNIMMGKPAMAVKLYAKVEKQLQLLTYFTYNEWTFTNNNTQQLWQRMALKDQQLFNFDMAVHDWEHYMISYSTGVRVYLLKDPLDTVPQARQRQRKIKLAHYSIVSVLIFSATILILFVFKCIYNKI